jgi:hypothetical protein
MACDLSQKSSILPVQIPNQIKTQNLKPKPQTKTSNQNLKPTPIQAAAIAVVLH